MSASTNRQTRLEASRDATNALRDAAFELRGALQRIVDAWQASEIGRVPKGLMDDAKAVLAKAEGR